MGPGSMIQLLEGSLAAILTLKIITNGLLIIMWQITL